MPGCLILLAPSKTMNFIAATPFDIAGETPLFLPEAAVIATKIASYTDNKIMKTMHVSATIAHAVAQYYSDWNIDKTGKAALWTYTGDVYKGLRASTMNRSEADWANKHLLISSGLYGLVRPFDGVQPYRLEMSAKIRFGRHRNLYEFWGRKLASYVDSSQVDWVCCLSSDEYARSVITDLPCSIITPVFLDTKPNGIVGTVPIYSKIMRGVMARWMIDHRAEKPKQLMRFSGHGYSYDPARSTETHPVFSRVVMTPLRFE